MKKSFFDYFFICHKKPERSFFYRGKQFPICSRCTGIFIGYIIGIIIIILSFLFNYQIPKPQYLFILITPMAIDGTMQFLTSYESTNIKRLITGILSGIAMMILIYYLGYLGYNHGKKIGDILFT